MTSRAGAVFQPLMTSDKSRQEMQKTCFKKYWDLAHQETATGVKTYPMTEYLDARTSDDEMWYKDFMPNYRIVPKDQLPANCTFGVKYTTLTINPQIFLPLLMQDLISKGVKFVRREVKSIEEAKKLTMAKMVVNASGLGAKALASDETVKPIRGQTMFVKSDFEELIMMDGAEYTYVIPRAGSGGVILGGIKSDRVDAEVDIGLKSDILRRVNRLTNNAFKDVDLSAVKDIVGFRPGRVGGLRIERQGDVVHAYGLGGAGYIWSWGLAEKVTNLIEGGLTKARI
ncbi:hypothetical protein BP6252_09967 [Coleophoma cylindrospora]|uniref:FAD dependent oxidoreductase domain-containing protein n=1 Tax=Coleophoma cylindrospora TaxID=1849047 RepID=A0A3D8QX16_9HELO|nr:hypothetical protein BP6252_09967 [Coleophoma cylindrospora]